MTWPEKSLEYIDKAHLFDKDHWQSDGATDSYLLDRRAPDFSYEERKIIAAVFGDMVQESVSLKADTNQLSNGQKLGATYFADGTVLLIDAERLNNTYSPSTPTIKPEPYSPNHYSYMLNCRPEYLISLQTQKLHAEGPDQQNLIPVRLAIPHPEGQPWEYLREIWYAIVVSYERRKVLYSFKKVRTDGGPVIHQEPFDYFNELHVDATVGETTFANFRDNKNTAIGPQYQRLLGVDVIAEGQVKLTTLVEKYKQHHSWLGRRALKHLK